MEIISFGKRFKQIRKKMGLTQEEMAQKLGYTRGCVANWEMDRRQPRQNQISKIANVLGVSTDYLIGAISWQEELEWWEKKEILADENTLDISSFSMEEKKLIIDYYRYIIFRRSEMEMHRRMPDEEEIDIE